MFVLVIHRGSHMTPRTDDQSISIVRTSPLAPVPLLVYVKSLKFRTVKGLALADIKKSWNKISHTNTDYCITI